MNDPKVFVIVLTYNEQKYAARCIQSLKNQTYQNLEILAIDNASKDETPNILRELLPPESIILNKKNLGFASGNNIGIRKALKAGADIIVLLNPDAEVESNFVEAGIDFLQQNPKAGMAVPTIVYGDKPDRIWYVGANVWHGKAVWRNRFLKIGEHIDKKKPLESHHQKPRQTDWATGCALFVTKDLLEKVGLLEEKLFLYGEDVDWSIRAQQAGFETWYFPGTVVKHYEPWQKKRKLKRLLKMLAHRSKARIYIVRHYYTPKEKLLYILKVVAWPVRQMFSK